MPVRDVIIRAARWPDDARGIAMLDTGVEADGVYELEVESAWDAANLIGIDARFGQPAEHVLAPEVSDIHGTNSIIRR